MNKKLKRIFQSEIGVKELDAAEVKLQKFNDFFAKEDCVGYDSNGGCFINLDESVCNEIYDD